MVIGGGIITRKLLFAVLLVASMSLIGIAGVSAANIGTAPTQTGNHHTVQKDINLHSKYIETLKEPIKTQKKVVKKSKTVKKTVNSTNNTTQFVNKHKTANSYSKNSVKAKNNTVTKSVPKYAGEKPKYAYGHKKKIKRAHKWYRYHGKWYRYHGKVHKYKKSTYRNHSKAHRYNRSSANSSSIKSLSHSLTKGTSSQYQKGARIFNWVRNNLRYSFYYNTKLGAAGALKYRKGNCADTSHLVVALARSAGLQAKYGHGKVRFSSGKVYGHVWAIIKANGKWYTADASSNRNTFGGMKGKVVRFQGYHNSLSF